MINSYTVTYDGNGNDGGTAPVDPNSPYTYGSTVTVLGPGTLTRTNFTFSHWNTAADDTGTSYNPGDTFTLGAANVVLYAQWTAVPTPTPTATSTATATATATSTATATATATATFTPTATATATDTPTPTATETATATATATATDTPTPTATATDTPTPTATATDTPTPTATATPVQCTTVCYVNDSTGNDSNGGASPGDAKKTIQAAVTQVTAGGTVIVAAGNYTENVSITKGMSLQGAPFGVAARGRVAAESIV